MIQRSHVRALNRRSFLVGSMSVASLRLEPGHAAPIESADFPPDNWKAAYCGISIRNEGGEHSRYAEYYIMTPKKGRRFVSKAKKRTKLLAKRGAPNQFIVQEGNRSFNGKHFAVTLGRRFGVKVPSTTKRQEAQVPIRVQVIEYFTGNDRVIYRGEGVSGEWIWTRFHKFRQD